MNILIETPIASPTPSTVTVITPHVGGGQNCETYWFVSSNLLTTMRANTIQARRLNEFCRASIIVEKCTEFLLDKKNISLDESKSKITLTIWIAWIWSYTEDNGMDNVFRVYNPYLNSEVYLLDDWVAYEYGKVS